jgi:hypothetical protein
VSGQAKYKAGTEAFFDSVESLDQMRRLFATGAGNDDDGRHSGRLKSDEK